MTGDLLIVAGVVFAINLLPAFGPPTWAVLVVLRLNLDVAGGAARARRRDRRGSRAADARARRARVAAVTSPTERIASLEALREAAERNRAGSIAGLALFAISPLPSAQLFIAAGITGVRLLPLTLAFFTGRLVSYSLYVGAATRDQGGARAGARRDADLTVGDRHPASCCSPGSSRS